MYRTRVNQPERVFLSSSDDTTSSAAGAYNSFQINFQTPIIGAKRTQLLRATIPNIQTNIPDYTLVFWYYRLPAANTPVSPTYLKCVRVLPANSTSALRNAPYNVPVNNYVNDPTALTVILNAAAASADDATANPYFLSGDVTFGYDVATKKMYVEGTNATFFYVPAGWADPNVATAAQLISLTPGVAATPGTLNQPYVPGYTLNLRLGFSMPGLLSSENQNPYGGIYPPAQGLTIYLGESYPDLVYSQCVYLYANIIPGSSLGSTGKHNLLCVVPSNAPSLSVINFTALMVNWLTKIASEIYTIKIEMFDDAGQPFMLPDNAQVNIEMAFWYGADMVELGKN
jgi:hypothetical protein